MDLSHCGIGEENGWALLDSLSEARINILNLSHNYLCASPFENYFEKCAKNKNKSLLSLDISSNHIKFESLVPPIKRFLQMNSGLIKLNLEDNFMRTKEVLELYSIVLQEEITTLISTKRNIFRPGEEARLLQRAQENFDFVEIHHREALRVAKEVLPDLECLRLDVFEETRKEMESFRFARKPVRKSEKKEKKRAFRVLSADFNRRRGAMTKEQTKTKEDTQGSLENSKIATQTPRNLKKEKGSPEIKSKAIGSRERASAKAEEKFQEALERGPNLARRCFSADKRRKSENIEMDDKFRDLNRTIDDFRYWVADYKAKNQIDFIDIETFYEKAEKSMVVVSKNK